jgi:hypothetical protein
MGIMMLETCWDNWLRINIRLVASCWFSLHLLFTMHGHMNVKQYLDLRICSGGLPEDGTLVPKHVGVETSHAL